MCIYIYIYIYTYIYTYLAQAMSDSSLERLSAQISIPSKEEVKDPPSRLTPAQRACSHA